jgi:ATP-binding cassette, subfamily C (CFTR/MRP), member 1
VCVLTVTCLLYALIAVQQVLFVVAGVGNCFVSSHAFLKLARMGMHAQTVLNTIIYTKSLRLSNTARQATSIGQCMTLMASDSQRIPDVAMTIHSLWTAPLFIAVAMYFLIKLVGVAAVYGVAFLLSALPLQGYIAVKQVSIQRTQMAKTDARVKLVNEILQGIKIIKLCAWEVPFQNRLVTLRDYLC